MQDPNSLSKLQKGDGKSLKRLFKAHSPKMFGLAYCICGDAQKSEEVVVKVFNDLWRGRQSLDPFQQITTKLYRDTINYLAGRTPIASLRIAIPGSADPRVGPLADEIARLDDLPRLVYMLSSVHGFSYKEIGHALNADHDSVVSLMGQALHGLHRVMA